MEILIAEDEKQIAEPLKKNFLEEGHHAMLAANGEEAFDLINKIKFDVIILDWKMPKVSGIDVCKKLRSDGNDTPILMLTALSQISSKVEALDAGADDYIIKPFSFRELLARVNAVKRRFNLEKDVLEYDCITIDLIKREVTNNKGKLINLSEKEFELLRYFISNKGNVIDREQLCKNIWGLSFNPKTNICDVTVKNLRKKLEENTNKKFIKTIYGEGYILINDE